MYQNHIYEMSNDLSNLKTFFISNIKNIDIEDLISYINTINNILIDTLDYYVLFEDKHFQDFLKQIALNIILLSSININDEKTIINTLNTLKAYNVA